MLGQIGAVWCNLCKLAQFEAVSSMLVKTDLVWCRFVQFGAHWFSLVHVGAV